jgi:hypothetical protein
VGSVLVVTDQPVGGHAADLVQGFEDVAVEDLVPVGPVEALDIRVLVRLAGLDEAQFDGEGAADGRIKADYEPWAATLSVGWRF